MELKLVTCSAGHDDDANDAALDDDANNGSASGSELPYSDNCIQLENISETETSGNKQHTTILSSLRNKSNA